MPINPIKEFFKRTKAEVKFARAGPGQTLSSDPAQPGPSGQSSAREAAAEAAMKRFSKDATKPAQRPRIATETRTLADTSQPNSSKDDKSRTEATTSKTVSRTELLVIDGVAQRDVQIYSTEELAQRMKQPEIDDEFFRLTVDDVKLIKQRYDEERVRNEILRTSEMRKREAESKRPTTNVARLRFKLPNDQIIDASFSGNETLSLVRDWLVAVCLEKMSLDLNNFDMLCGLRPYKSCDFVKSLRELGLLPATTITINWYQQYPSIWDVIETQRGISVACEVPVSLIAMPLFVRIEIVSCDAFHSRSTGKNILGIVTKMLDTRPAMIQVDLIMPSLKQILGLDKVSNLALIIRHNGGFIGSFKKLFYMDDLKYGQLIGEDSLGNKYYENPYYFHPRNRWVEFNPEVGLQYNSSQVPPEWHRWLTHMTEHPPTIEKPVSHSWLLPHQENATGSIQSYMPHSTVGPKTQAWTPKNKGK